jgi:hypothetical protein
MPDKLNWLIEAETYLEYHYGVDFAELGIDDTEFYCLYGECGSVKPNQAVLAYTDKNNLQES